MGQFLSYHFCIVEEIQTTDLVLCILTRIGQTVAEDTIHMDINSAEITSVTKMKK